MRKFSPYLCITLFLLVSQNLLALSDIEKAFVQRMVDKHGFKAEYIEKYLNKAVYKQRIIDAISRPAEKTKAWFEYRPIFITKKRAKQGLQFWRENEALLTKAERQFGVPAEIITAIIGVETRYGRFTGNYRVLDSVSTIGFHYKKRGKFFQSELAQFFLLCREEGIDPTIPTGSYAGAMGMPQFISSSFRSLAYDFDKDGKKDIWKSNADVIGSVANYFHHHQWHAGEAVASLLKNTTKVDEKIKQTGRKAQKPSLSLRLLRAKKLPVNKNLDDNMLASIIKLKQKKQDEYWLGLHNFYVVTRYNHSNLYAMAVFQLSQKIKALHDQAKK